VYYSKRPLLSCAWQLQSVLDELDRQILQHLQDDARRSHREIARATSSTQPTVTARITRMEDAGIILGYRVQLDEDAFATDIHGPVAVVCHWCKKRAHDAVWSTHARKKHPFCCATCQSAYGQKFARMSEGL
jgi:DNA-binding Lrp family transcriptional regulator